MNNGFLEQIKKALSEKTPEDTIRSMERLQAQGLLDEDWNVTGQFHRWDAYLAIIEVRYDADNKIVCCKSFSPIFGRPEGPERVDSREQLVEWLRAGKKLITAWRDERLELWREGQTVVLSSEGFITIEGTNEGRDCLGDVPENETLEVCDVET